MEIEPEGAAGGDVLNETAAAVDIQRGVVHGLFPCKNIHPPGRPDPVGKTGGLGVFGQHGDGHIRVNGTHLLQNCFQNGVVPGVATAIGPADYHAVPLLFGAAVPAENFFVDMELGVHRALDGELGGRLFVEFFAHLPPQGIVAAQRGQIAP